MKNTKANRIKFLQKQFDVIASDNYDKKKLLSVAQQINTGKQVVVVESFTELRSELRSELWLELGSELRSELWLELSSELWLELRWGNVFEYYEFVWPIFIAEFYPQLKTIKRNKKKIEILSKLLQSGCGYLSTNKKKIWLLPMPQFTLNTNKRLHNTPAPALKLLDKESYWLNGVKFEKDLFNKLPTMSAKKILAISDMEQRRAAYEIMDKVKMKKLGEKVLDEVKDDGYGYPMRIIQVDVNDMDLRYLNCFCPTTGREYYLETRETECQKAKLGSFGLTNSFDKEF